MCKGTEKGCTVAEKQCNQIPEECGFALKNRIAVLKQDRSFCNIACEECQCNHNPLPRAFQI